MIYWNSTSKFASYVRTIFKALTDFGWFVPVVLYRGFDLFASKNIAVSTPRCITLWLICGVVLSSISFGVYMAPEKLLGAQYEVGPAIEYEALPVMFGKQQIVLMTKAEL